MTRPLAHRGGGRLHGQVACGGAVRSAAPQHVTIRTAGSLLYVAMAMQPNPLYRATANRDLARRARRIAAGLANSADITRLVQYAQKLEAQAAKAETESEASGFPAKAKG